MKTNFEVMRMDYKSIVNEPQKNAEILATFLNLKLDVIRMKKKVNKNLYRNNL
jgi:hypothetical protein